MTADRYRRSHYQPRITLGTIALQVMTYPQDEALQLSCCRQARHKAHITSQGWLTVNLLI